jgi:hypothetical protein
MEQNKIGRGYEYTDSVGRRPELSLRPRISWTEGQNSRCVHGFRGPKARTLVAFTDSVDRTPELSLRPRIPWTERQNIVAFRIVRVTDSDAMKSRGGFGLCPKAISANINFA